mmetsp:Transcript_58171/g.165380  ORF Transcript_58171/g.165380 Transcript_58171/m.165380 type:complete len:452 (-) Transcript_58171:140-1495(-)
MRCFHWAEAPHGEVVKPNLHRTNIVISEPKHAKHHLGSTLVITHLELKKRYAHEHCALILRNLEHLLQISLQVCVVRRSVVLPDEYGRPPKAGVISVEEEGPYVPRRIGGVHAVHETLPVGSPEVVRGLVANTPWVTHRPPQLSHLSHRCLAAKLLAVVANGEGEGGSEVQPQVLNARFLLRVEHGIEGAHHRSTEVGGVCDRWELQIWLIHNDQWPECTVVRLSNDKAAPQHLTKLNLDLLVAVEACARAVPVHLDVRVVADADDDLQPLLQRLVQERLVVDARVIAVEPHGVGAERPHRRQIPAPSAPPERRGLRGHEVVVLKPPVALEGHRGVADALEDLLGPRCQGRERLRRRGRWGRRELRGRGLGGRRLARCGARTGRGASRGGNRGADCGGCGGALGAQRVADFARRGVGRLCALANVAFIRPQPESVRLLLEIAEVVAALRNS